MQAPDDADQAAINTTEFWAMVVRSFYVSEVGGHDGRDWLAGVASSWVSTPLVSLKSALSSIPNAELCVDRPRRRAAVGLRFSSWPVSALDGIARCIGSA